MYIDIGAAYFFRSEYTSFNLDPIIGALVQQPSIPHKASKVAQNKW